MILTPENYHSLEASRKYLSVSQYKDFAGCLGSMPCEARAMAILRGEYASKQTEAMKVSSYVDAYFAGTLDLFKMNNPEIFKKDGSLLAKYEHMNTVIARIERDELFMKALSGQKQVIMTAVLFGVEWKIMVDSFVDDFCLTDLKVMAEITKAHYAKDFGHMNFVTYYGYDIQAAIYQKIADLNLGKKLPFVIAAASKEDEPDIELIGFQDDTAYSELDKVLEEVRSNVPRIIKLKNNEIDPVKCGQCDYCRSVKKLTRVIHHSELINKM